MTDRRVAAWILSRPVRAAWAVAVVVGASVSIASRIRAQGTDTTHAPAATVPGMRRPQYPRRVDRHSPTLRGPRATPPR